MLARTKEQKATTNEFVKETSTYKIEKNAQNSRIYDITVNEKAVEKFFEKVRENDITVERLEYTPYERRMASLYLLESLEDQGFGEILRGIIHDRATGGFTIGVEGVTEDTDDFVIYSTAVSHLLGTPNFDAMTGKYYARFTVKDTDDSDSYLRQAYRLFTLHTDGTFVDEPTDWLIMQKMVEENSVGGESRLLHLDDWEELDRFYEDPLARHKFTYIAPPSKNVTQEVERETFFKVNDLPCMCFIDQFAYPESIEQAKYLKDLSDSMEADPHVVELELPVGRLVALNNMFWLHGRAAFEKHPELNRELLRQRGRFDS